MQKALQRDDLDPPTRNRLWTLLTMYIWDRWNASWQYEHDAGAIQTLLDRLWFKFFKRPSDSQPPFQNEVHDGSSDYYGLLRKTVLNGEWFNVLDLVEFIVNDLPESFTTEFCEKVNLLLVEENSAYRIVGKQFAEITNDAEIEEIDSAASSGLDGVSSHILSAIKFLSDRKKPDFRNSIKESISAVESMVKVLTNSKSATLSDGLKALKSSTDLHPALLDGFGKIYAYTSDAQGIRHALFDKDKTSFSDAKYMLVSCSAFINYVIGKFAETGRELK